MILFRKYKLIHLAEKVLSQSPPTCLRVCPAQGKEMGVDTVRPGFLLPQSLTTEGTLHLMWRPPEVLVPLPTLVCLPQCVDWKVWTEKGAPSCCWIWILQATPAPAC